MSGIRLRRGSALKLEYHPEAAIEIYEAIRWYAERAPEAAARFEKELLRAERLVLQRPQIWGPYFHSTRCFRLRRFPFGLVYIERGQRIIGIAVAHFKRRPGYWRDRMAS